MIKKKDALHPFDVDNNTLLLFKGKNKECKSLTQEELQRIEKYRIRTMKLMKSLDPRTQKLIQLSLRLYGHYLSLITIPMSKEQAENRFMEIKRIILELRKNVGRQ